MTADMKKINKILNDLRKINRLSNRLHFIIGLVGGMVIMYYMINYM